MEDTSADLARVRSCSIILVHGTWGRGFFPKDREVSLYPPNKRRWFEEGSHFCVSLGAALKNASLEWPIRAFLWSGANSVHARDISAKALSDHLRNELQDDTDARAVIIAHSHGGNLALRALQHLNSMAGQIKVVTLATPFLRVFAHRSSQLSFVPAQLVYAAIFTTLFFSYRVGIIWIMVAIGLSDIEVENWDYLGIVIASVLGIGTSNFAAQWLLATLTNMQAALAIEEEASYDTKGLVGRVLVIRGVDDEASLSLAAGSVGSRLSYLVLVGVIPAIWLVTSILLLLPMVGPLFFFQGESLMSKFHLVIFGAMFLAPLFLVLPGVIKSAVFGREFLVNALVCDIAVDSVPDTLGQVEAITLKPVELTSSELGWQTPHPSEEIFSLRWWVETHRIWWREWDIKKVFKLRTLIPLRELSLRHGIYDHPRCVDEIVRWLQS
jgi:hypothetical protein